MRRWCLAMLVAATTAGCIDVLAGSDPPDTPESLFRIVWEDFDRHYALFEAKGVDWRAVRERYQPQADAAEPGDPIAGVIGAMFAELRDPHVDLFAPPRFFHSVDPGIVRTYFSSSTVASRYLTSSRLTASRNMRYGLLSSDIGYVYIGTFGGSGWSDEIDAVLESFGNASTVIVDVRNNGGGTSNTAEAIAGRFVDRERVFAYIRWRNGPSHGDLTDYIEMRVRPVGRRFTGNVIVLTNRKAVSASEHFVLALRSHPGIVFVGDTTAGGFGNPMIRELPNGWTYRLPQWAEYGAEKESYEGIGLAPNIVVPATAADSAAGRDAQLEAALQRASSST